MTCLTLEKRKCKHAKASILLRLEIVYDGKSVLFAPFL